MRVHTTGVSDIPQRGNPNIVAGGLMCGTDPQAVDHVYPDDPETAFGTVQCHSKGRRRA